MPQLHSFRRRFLPLAWMFTASSLLWASVGAQARLRYVGADTVEAVVAAAQAEYGRGHAGYKVDMQEGSTSTGLGELCSGRAAIVGTSRAITPDEARTCTSAGIQPVEFPLAFDAVALIVPNQNIWLAGLTMTELSTLFSPAASGKLLSWHQLRESFPDVPIRPAGVGTGHSTFGFFTESLGLKSAIRPDAKSFSDAMEAGRYVAAEAGAIGFIPASNASELPGQVRTIGVDFGEGAVVPKTSVVRAGKYEKLTRTVFLYINPALLTKAKADPQDVEFTRLLLKEMETFVSSAHLIPLSSAQYRENIKRAAFSN